MQKHDAAALISFHRSCAKNCSAWAVAVARLVEWSLPTPEVRGSNTAIDKIYIDHLFTVKCNENDKIKKKRPGMAHLKTIQLTKVT